MPSTERPNILIFIPHDLGDHLGCYGKHTVQSPELDLFAAEGVRLTNCFTTAAECCASRGGLFTGLYSHQHGQMGLTHFGWEFFAETKHLAAHLADGGYQTHLFGIQHVTRGDPSRLGFENHHALNAPDCETICESLKGFLKSSDADSDQPWFAQVGFRQVHRGSRWPEAVDFSSDDIEVPAYLPDNETSRGEFARYHQCIRNLDSQIGQVLETLQASGNAENTLVVFTTDHGIPFPHAKSTFYDPGIRVTCLIQWPGQFEGRREHQELISNIDIFPTVLEAAGVAVPEACEGRSFLPLLNGEPYERRNEVFGALYYDVAYDPMHYVRTDRYKFIRSFACTAEDAEGADPSSLPKDDTGLWIRLDDLDVQNSDTWKTIAGPNTERPAEELYDLEADPLEQKNLVHHPGHAEILRTLRGRMDAMMERTDSPLLSGHVLPSLSSSNNQPIR